VPDGDVPDGIDVPDGTRNGRENTPRALPGLVGPRLGSVIGGTFGFVYVEANAGSLPAPAPTTLRIAAVVALALLVALIALPRGGLLARDPQGTAPGGFGTRYWLVVVGEGAAIVAGAAILSGPLATPRAVVAWVSLVVGVHFLALAAIWELSLFRFLGAAVASCGAAGLAVAGAGAGQPMVAALGGVLPGVLLLVASYWSTLSVRSAGSGIGTAGSAADPRRAGSPPAG
jgi:hypothetical protein